MWGKRMPLKNKWSAGEFGLVEVNSNSSMIGKENLSPELFFRRLVVVSMGMWVWVCFGVEWSEFLYKGMKVVYWYGLALFSKDRGIYGPCNMPCNARQIKAI